MPTNDVNLTCISAEQDLAQFVLDVVLHSSQLYQLFDELALTRLVWQAPLLQSFVIALHSVSPFSTLDKFLRVVHHFNLICIDFVNY